MEIKIILEKLKPHKCQFCPQIYGFKSQLQRHVRTVHDKNKNFNCDLFNKSIGLNKDLTVHRKRVPLKTKSFVKHVLVPKLTFIELLKKLIFKCRADCTLYFW